MVPWPRALSFCPPLMVQATRVPAPEVDRAVSWSVVVVSRADFSALMSKPPGLAATGELIAPQPAIHSSRNGVAANRSLRLILRITAPNHRQGIRLPLLTDEKNYRRA